VLAGGRGGAGTVVVTSPSKPFNIAGLQCAAVVAPDRARRARLAAGLRRDELFSPNVFAIAAGAAAYNEAEPWLDEVRAYVAENRAWATGELARLAPDAHVVEAQGTYLMWIDVRAWTQDSVGFASRMRRATGLVVDPGALFGPGGEGFVRLNIAAPRGRVEDGVGRLAKALELEAKRAP
jgi:cystathionine beta-lyase